MFVDIVEMFVDVFVDVFVNMLLRCLLRCLLCLLRYCIFKLHFESGKVQLYLLMRID